MTYQDFEEKYDMGTSGRPVDIQEAINQVLETSFHEDRLTWGAYDCAHELETNGDHVMICILPETDQVSVPVRIQHTLIEAYCRENNISVIKLKLRSSLGFLLTKKKETTQVKTSSADHLASHVTLERTSSNPRDLSCLLVRCPDEMSIAEKRVLAYCDVMTSGTNDGVVETPD